MVEPYKISNDMGLGAQVLGGLLQEEPDVPDFKKIDLQETQKKTIEGNIDVIPKLGELSRELASIVTEQIQTTMESLFPGTTDLKKDVTDSITSNIRGDVPEDVQDLISRRAAERGFATGTAGGQFAEFGELLTLGQTSMQLRQAGINSALAWLQQAQGGTPRVDVSGQLLNPTFAAQFEQRERDAQFQRDFVANQISAAFSPGTIIGNAILNSDAQITQIASSLVGRVGGPLGFGTPGG